MSILEQGLTDTGTYQLKALRMAVHTTLARHLRALCAVLSASDDFPLDADEHPHLSLHELGDFGPENEGAFSLRFRAQVAR
jgi:hypothetical protein